MALTANSQVASTCSDSGYRRSWVHDPTLSPRTDNGETEFFSLLQARGETALYEPQQFELESWQPFTVDFAVPASRHHGEVYFEVTFLDKGLARVDLEIEAALTNRKVLRALRLHRAELLQRIERKYGKIAETEQLHGVKIVLVTYALWCAIVADPDILDIYLGPRPPYLASVPKQTHARAAA